MNDVSRELSDGGIDRIRVEIGAGLVEILPGEGDETHARVHFTGPEEDLTVKVVGSELVVEVSNQTVRRPPKVRVRIETPATLVARVKTGAGDIVADAPLGEARLQTGTGDIRLERTEGPLTAGTGSGDLRLRHAAGPVRATTGSGSIEISSAENLLALSTGSGDVRIGDTAAPTTVKVGSGDISIQRIRDHSVATSGSGDVRVELADGPSVRAETARGDVQIGVPDGVPTYLDLRTVTGEIRCDLEPGSEPAEGERSLRLRAHTVSGDITVLRV